LQYYYFLSLHIIYHLIIVLENGDINNVIDNIKIKLISQLGIINGCELIDGLGLVDE
jgi:hypothetical protein